MKELVANDMQHVKRSLFNTSVFGVLYSAVEQSSRPSNLRSPASDDQASDEKNLLNALAARFDHQPDASRCTKPSVGP